MTLALLIMAVTGAWAQSTFGVKEITADMLPASWSTDNSAVTADDLAKLGFMAVTKDAAKTWTGAPQEGIVRLVYTLCESVNWVKGEGGYESTYSSRKVFYSCLDGQRIFITTEITEWDLTSQDGKNWILDKMPANDIELQVEYYAESNLFLSEDALADKANISVTAGDLGVQFGDDGKSANTVMEGQTVTVKYTGSKKVIGVKAEKKSAAPATKTLTLSGTYYNYNVDDYVTKSLTIEYTDNDTWSDIAGRYDEVSIQDTPLGPEGKIIYFWQDLNQGADGCQVKSKQSTYNYELVSINDKVSAYSSYYLGN